MISLPGHNQVFSKSNIRADNSFGHYLLFNEDFLQELITAGSIPQESSLFDVTGYSLSFSYRPKKLSVLSNSFLNMNEELKGTCRGRGKAIRVTTFLSFIA